REEREPETGVARGPERWPGAWVGLEPNGHPGGTVTTIRDSRSPSQTARTENQPKAPPGADAGSPAAPTLDEAAARRAGAGDPDRLEKPSASAGSDPADVYKRIEERLGGL